MNGGLDQVNIKDSFLMFGYIVITRGLSEKVILIQGLSPSLKRTRPLMHPGIRQRFYCREPVVGRLS
jgi:hypothetical protein